MNRDFHTMDTKQNYYSYLQSNKNLEFILEQNMSDYGWGVYIEGFQIFYYTLLYNLNAFSQ